MPLPVSESGAQPAVYAGESCGGGPTPADESDGAEMAEACAGAVLTTAASDPSTGEEEETEDTGEGELELYGDDPSDDEYEDEDEDEYEDEDDDSAWGDDEEASRPAPKTTRRSSPVSRMALFLGALLLPLRRRGRPGGLPS